jgi:hypothetical protein
VGNTTPHTSIKVTDSQNDNDNRKELLKIHQRMHHISFAKLKEMAKQGMAKVQNVSIKG